MSNISNKLSANSCSKADYKPNIKENTYEELLVGKDLDELDEKRQKAVEKLKQQMNTENLWNAIILYEGYSFTTAKGLEYSYTVKGNEIFFSRKEKSVTRASVDIAFKRVLELEHIVTGPKKLGIFGASYIYPVFIRIGIIKTHYS